MCLAKGGTPWKNIANEVIGKDNVPKAATKWITYDESSRPACRYPDCALGKNGMETCKATGVLKIIVGEMKVYGVIEVLLGAKNDIPTVAAQLYEIEQIAGASGVSLSMVPLLLWRAERSVSTPSFSDGSKRQRVQKSLVNIGIEWDFFSRILDGKNRYSLASADTFGSDRPQLSPAMAAYANGLTIGKISLANGLA